MTVHSCGVDDGASVGLTTAGSAAVPIQLLDENGCSLDPFLLPNLDYISDLVAVQVGGKAWAMTQCVGCRTRAYSSTPIAVVSCSSHVRFASTSRSRAALARCVSARRDVVRVQSAQRPQCTDPVPIAARLAAALRTRKRREASEDDALFVQAPSMTVAELGVQLERACHANRLAIRAMRP